MVKPRIFVSSTYYDLKHIRNSLKSFINSFGYEAVLFENGNIPYNYQLPLAESCYSEVMRCHMLVLIIGGRYGNPSSKSKSTEDNKNHDTYKSITVKEYQTAFEKNIPIFIFIERNVYSEYRTYKANLDNSYFVKYAYVDNVKVFEFIDQILSQEKNNPVCEFDTFDDISNWLRDQWAGLLEECLRQRQDRKYLFTISSKIDELSQVSEALKTYTESIMEKVIPNDYKKIIENEHKRSERANKMKLFFESFLYRFVKNGIELFCINLSDDQVYSLFLQTNSLKEFLGKIDLPIDVLVTSTHKDRLKKNYDEITMAIKQN